MNNTPKPQANTVNKILNSFRQETIVIDNNVSMIGKEGKKAFDQSFEEATKQIQALITEARIDEVTNLMFKAKEYYEYTIQPHMFEKPIKQSLERRVEDDAVPTSEFIDRLKQLKENK